MARREGSNRREDMVISLQTLCFVHLHSSKVRTDDPHAFPGGVNVSFRLRNFKRIQQSRHALTMPTDNRGNADGS
jgi:hypothetical protein